MLNLKLIANIWMLHQTGGVNKKWNTLEHNGVLFPPEYVKHNVPVVYQGMEIILDQASEEYATLYAKYIDKDYIKNKTFRKNFWNDWKKVLGTSSIIKNLEDVDFTLIFNYLAEKKEEKKMNPDDKTKKAEDDEKYGWALVDGKRQPIGNFRMEPPGIFLGRGNNPNLGKVKKRIYPEDVIINIGNGAQVPTPLPGHKWKKVVHDKSVEWLASWKDDITGKTKYVWLGALSDMRAKNDMAKFDLARKLKRKIKEIRLTNTQSLTNDDPKIRQIATALYFIDNFALRVGNEKGEDETDTVGVTSLRPEHVVLLDDNRIKLDFLGKDSVRYNRTLTVIPEIYNNISEFISNKDPTSQLFDLISSSDVNKYLQHFMKDLTAKVFRTFNASNLFQKELKKINKKYSNYQGSDKKILLLDEFNKANAKVALLCNHQKNITKSSSQQIEKIDHMIKETRKKLKEAKNASKKNPAKIEKLKSQIKKLKSKKELKCELKNISLGTSKINYIDPRISIAFLKKNELPIDKIFTKTLQGKFQWAANVDSDFSF